MYKNHILSLVVLMVFASLCMADSPKVYKLDDKGFVRDWLVAGPFPNEPTANNGKPEGFDRDFLKNIGGEAKAEPFAGLVMKNVLFFADKAKLIAKVGATNAWGFIESKTIDVTWRELHWDKKSPIIKLDNMHPDFCDHHITYLATYVKSPRRMGISAQLGTDDGFKLWVNGKLVRQTSTSRGTLINQDRISISLNKGVNRILLKVSERVCDHSMALRLVGHNVDKLKGVEILLVMPIRRLIALCENLDSVNIRDWEFFGNATLGPKPYLVGGNTLSVKLANEEPVTASLEMQLKGPAGRSVWQKKAKKKLDIKRAVTFCEKVNLSKEGKYTLSIKATDESGKSIFKVSRNFNVQGPVSLQAKRKELTDRTEKLNTQLAEKGKQLLELQKQVKTLRDSNTEQCLRMENIYAFNRKELIKSYGPKAKSIDKPFNPASIRSTICLNGDTWEIAPAKSTGRKSIDESVIPTKGWETISVPTFGCEYYFRGLYWPMKGGKLQYSPATVALDTERAGDFTINPGREYNALYLRTQFTLPKGWDGKRVFLCCDNAIYKIKVWVNGKLTGEHKGGWIDPLNMDISEHLKPGENELMVFAGRRWLYDKFGATGEAFRLWGLIGDVYLKSKPDIYVSDTWIIPRWRKATIETLTYITNTTKRTITVKMLQQAVLAGRVKLDSAEKTVRVGPGVTVEVHSETPWSDPQLWGIGGKYGQPVLHDMVTTLTEAKGKDVKIIDQHFQRFGYREFWKTKFDFFLNGKRIFLQGDVWDARTYSHPRQFWTPYLKLLRDGSNINIIRPHYSIFQGQLARYCDEAGMLMVGQMYPFLEKGLSLEMWKSSRRHQRNLDIYRAWVKWLRNHPSVVVYNTDNEVFMQHVGNRAIPDCINDDKKAALYGQYVKSLDPTRIVTRSGDQGTWGKLGAWQEDPPAEVANYHYPDYTMGQHIVNWQSTYEKPLLSGECLYTTLAFLNQYIGAIPSQIRLAALRLQRVLSIYRDLEVPGWVAMGLSHEGFIELKDGGTPFGFGFNQAGDFKSRKIPILTAEHKKKLPAFPYYRLRWPAQSGPGIKEDFARCFDAHCGHSNVNWYHSDYPIAVLNACNKAYKKYTHPMPPLGDNRTAEVIYHISKDGKPVSGAMVFLTPAGGQATEPIGVRADKAGLAWFLIPRTGNYTLSVAGTAFSRKVNIKPMSNDMKAGFNYVPHVTIDLTERKASK